MSCRPLLLLSFHVRATVVFKKQTNKKTPTNISENLVFCFFFLIISNIVSQDKTTNRKTFFVTLK